MPKEKLVDNEITATIAEVPDCKVVDGKLNRAFKFNSFIESFAADKMDRHSEIFNIYNRVVIDLANHDVDDLSTLDIELAKSLTVSRLRNFYYFDLNKKSC